MTTKVDEIKIEAYKCFAEEFGLAFDDQRDDMRRAQEKVNHIIIMKVLNKFNHRYTNLKFCGVFTGLLCAMAGFTLKQTKEMHWSTGGFLRDVYFAGRVSCIDEHE